MLFKKRILIYLIACTILLLILNTVIEFFNRPIKAGNEFSKELTTYQIDSVFIDVLDKYGIESRWITTKSIKVTDEDSLKKQLIVKLPADLPIPLIIRDFHKIIENDITGFVSNEKKMFGNTEIRVYTNEQLKLQALLVSDPLTIRERNKLTFVFSDANYLSQSEFNQFLGLPYYLSMTIVPSDAAVLKADSLKKYSKEYLILLNDEMTDKNYKLETGDQKALLKNSLNNIAVNFPNAKKFLIDEGSRLFNSVIYNFIRDEFNKKKIDLIPLSEFILLEASNENELISKFKFHCMDGSGSKQKTFLLTFENFVKIRGELELFKKKGHTVIPISQIAK
jgi:hypothetical protein